MALKIPELHLKPLKRLAQYDAELRSSLLATLQATKASSDATDYSERIAVSLGGRLTSDEVRRLVSVLISMAGPMIENKSSAAEFAKELGESASKQDAEFAPLRGALESFVSTVLVIDSVLLTAAVAADQHRRRPTLLSASVEQLSPVVMSAEPNVASIMYVAHQLVLTRLDSQGTKQEERLFVDARDLTDLRDEINRALASESRIERSVAGLSEISFVGRETNV